MNTPVSSTASPVGHSIFKPRLSFELQVPDAYRHQFRLRNFRREFQRSDHFYQMDGEFNDYDFRNPSVILSPGMRFTVTLFEIGGIATLDSGLEFLRGLGSMFVGAQGTTVLCEVSCDEFPRAKKVLCLDERTRLPRHDTGFALPYFIHFSTGSKALNIQSSTSEFKGDYLASFVKAR